MERTDLIYDIELYSNFFLCCTLEVQTGIKKAFEISPYKDDRKELSEYLRDNKRLFGYNSLNFDGKVLLKLFNNYHLKGKQLVSMLKEHSDKLIKLEKYRQFAGRLHTIPNIDLMKIHHFDNKAKMTSLKDLEFVFGLANIQELPFPHDSILTKDQMQVVEKYCWNDIDATYQFYIASLDKIKFRERMSVEYGINFMNYNDVKIGEAILLDAIAKASGIDPTFIKKMRTYRDEMRMEDIILPYITFVSEEFNTFLSWWKTKTITETKGQFTEIPLEDVQEILPYCNNKLKKGKLKNLNIVYKGFQFDFGTGGIHGACGSGVWEEDEEHELILVDVSSYYPNLAEKNRFHPKHIDVDLFVDTIAKLYAQRMNAKEEGDKEMVAAIKLALNGALYGKSNSEHSFMFDPQFMMSICVNGQLLLVSLAEQIMDAGMELIQINTDGILVRLKRTDRPVLDGLCQMWMRTTKLKLDYDHFDKVIQKDVNNYIARYTNGKIKRKGSAFAWDKENEMEYHKNFSHLIVQKAIQAYFLEGIDPEEFLEFSLMCDAVEDFFIRVKINKRDRLVAIRGEFELELQRTTRYVVSHSGMTLIKIMPPLPKKPDVIRRNNVEAGWECMVCNNLNNIDREQLKLSINLDYYLTKINKVIDVIEQSEKQDTRESSESNIEV